MTDAPISERPAPVISPTVALELLEALKAIQFGFSYRRCPMCAGFNVGPYGETDNVHTSECPVVLAIKRAENELAP